MRRTPPKRIRKRSAELTIPSMGMALYGKPGSLDGSTVLLVSPRVGTPGLKLPAGYELSSCDICKHATWVNAAFVASCERRGNPLRVECMNCCEIDVFPAK